MSLRIQKSDMNFVKTFRIIFIDYDIKSCQFITLIFRELSCLINENLLYVLCISVYMIYKTHIHQVT